MDVVQTVSLLFFIIGRAKYYNRAHFHFKSALNLLFLILMHIRMMVVFKIFGIFKYSYFWALFPLTPLIFVGAFMCFLYVLIITVCYWLTCAWVNDKEKEKNMTAFFVVLYSFACFYGLALLDSALVEQIQVYVSHLKAVVIVLTIY